MQEIKMVRTKRIKVNGIPTTIRVPKGMKLKDVPDELWSKQTRKPKGLIVKYAKDLVKFT